MNAKVFVGFTTRDTEWLETVKSFLFPHPDGTTNVDVWDFEKIDSASKGLCEIERAMVGSSCSLLLISQNFLELNFVSSQAIGKIVELSQKGHRVLWLPVSQSTVMATDLGRLQAVWDPNKPLASLSRPKRERALCDIAKILDGFTKADLQSCSALAGIQSGNAR